jgi:hypothetical protein
MDLLRLSLSLAEANQLGQIVQKPGSFSFPSAVDCFRFHRMPQSGESVTLTEMFGLLLGFSKPLLAASDRVVGWRRFRVIQAVFGCQPAQDLVLSLHIKQISSVEFSFPAGHCGSRPLGR